MEDLVAAASFPNSPYRASWSCGALEAAWVSGSSSLVGRADMLPRTAPFLGSGLTSQLCLFQIWDFEQITLKSAASRFYLHSG